ncbi:unannotated protein [freshwater metagenome]|uniref:Unannotated protein n=1 Tax=freshwater metagenome TaxID=449393 RepID=A0A6J7DGD1_9ZZZZ|nr:rhodanese-like domain-containing protein [Actinomycetota bacterium]
MKKLALAIVAALTLTACSSTGGAVTTMNSSEFSAKAKEPGVVVLDVRTREEFISGHIEGAINIDVESTTFANEIAKLDKSQSYAVYCRSGRRSLVAVDQMESTGFKSIANLKNGIVDWVANGYPVVMN